MVIVNRRIHKDIPLKPRNVPYPHDKRQVSISVSVELPPLDTSTSSSQDTTASITVDPPTSSSPTLTSLAPSLPDTSDDDGGPSVTPPPPSSDVDTTSSSPTRSITPESSSPPPTSSSLTTPTSQTTTAETTISTSTGDDTTSEVTRTTGTSTLTQPPPVQTTQTTVVVSVVEITSDGGAVIITSTSYSTSTAPLSLSPASSSSSSAGSLNDSSGSGSGGFFHNTGAVVGVFLVVGLVAAGILLGLGFLYFRRKRAKALDEDIRVAAGGAGAGGAGTSRFHEEDDLDYDGSDGSNPTYPQMSQHGHNSAYMGSYEEPMSAHSHSNSNPFASSGNRMSFAPSMGSMGPAAMGAGVGAGAAAAYGGLARSPSSNQDHWYYNSPDFGAQQQEQTHPEWSDYVNAYGRPPSDEKEHSSSSEGHAMPVDQRLDPRAMLEHMHENNGSEASLRDGADYSRPLRVQNPDVD